MAAMGTVWVHGPHIYRLDVPVGIVIDMNARVNALLRGLEGDLRIDKYTLAAYLPDIDGETMKRLDNRLSLFATGAEETELTRAVASKSPLFIELIPPVEGAVFTQTQEDPARQTSLYYVVKDHKITVQNKGSNIGLLRKTSGGGFCIGRYREPYTNSTVDQAMTLVDTTGKIDEAGFKLLVPKLDARLLANALKANSFEIPSTSNGYGEMFFQQTIYSSFAMLFMAAGPSLDSYAADEEVHSSMFVNFKVNSADSEFKPGDMTIKPDGAVMLNGKCDPFGMMEINPRDKSMEEAYPIDNDRCVLMTACTAMAIFKSCLPIFKPSHGGYALPFIVGTGKNCSLYVTRVFFKESKYVLATYPVKGNTCADVLNSPNTGRSKLFVALAVLLNQFLAFFDNDKRRAYEDIYRTPFEVEGSSGRVFSGSGSKRKSEGQAKGSSGKASKTGTDGSPSNTTVSKSHAEDQASLAATCGGKFCNIVYPSSRRVRLTDEGLDVDYQTESPFFFKGDFSPLGSHNERKVFLKVWDAAETNWDSVLSECQLHWQAHNAGVPVATPFLRQEEIRSQLDNGREYFVVAMEYAPFDPIRNLDDLFHFFVSLVEAVNELHCRTGNLHCDLKPPNMRWSNGKVVLVDFGHAQPETNASHYRGTEGFEAPEIVEHKPHSRSTDSFAVGKTILHIFDRLDRDGDKNRRDRLQLIAQNLTIESPQSRWTLDQALEALRNAPVGGESITGEMAPTEVPKALSSGENHDTQKKITADLPEACQWKKKSTTVPETNFASDSPPKKMPRLQSRSVCAN